MTSKKSASKPKFKIDETTTTVLSPIQSLITDIQSINLETQDILFKIGNGLTLLRALDPHEEQAKKTEESPFKDGALRDLELQKFVAAHNLSIAQGLLAHLNQIVY